jgi:cytoskeletal protein CcmA (bactofilin family)
MAQGSVIGSDTVVRGNVQGQGSLEILGRVEGDVDVTGDVVIGEAGAVLGSVDAAKISVHGAVQGDLRGKEAVLVERGGKVVGDLSAPRIGIADGGLVRGHVRTDGEPAAAPARRAAASPAVRSVGASAGGGVGAFPPKPVAKVEPPRTAPSAMVSATGSPGFADDDVPESESPTPRPKAEERDKPVERRPPPPVLPSLGKGAKAKKKKDRDS